MYKLPIRKLFTMSVAISVFGLSASAKADSVTEWNLKSRGVVGAAKMSPAHANRALAIVHTSVYEAVNAITKKYPLSLELNASDGADIDAAIASAVMVSLLNLAPEHQSIIDKYYAEEMSSIPDSKSKTDGIDVGQQAAESIWEKRGNDGSMSPDIYRPSAVAGKYVPTTLPAVPQWCYRNPWMLSRAGQFRPGAPPKLTSDIWVRDFNEVKKMGQANSAHRSDEQTKIAKFWEATLPPIYHGLVHSVADMPDRDITQNARLFAAVTRASDDAIIAVFEAKYYYGLWRPVTAIRNADIDGNPATQRDAGWIPYISTPMHPEYPCAHCVVAGTVGEILKAEIGDGQMPKLTTVSYTAGGAERSWDTVDEFVQEVSEARIYDGVHYRNSTDVGTSMGIQIGKLAADIYLAQD